MTTSSAHTFGVLTLFGTRPEVIKLAPVIHALENRPETFQTCNVTSGQHSDILYPFVKQFNLRIDADLALHDPRQTPIDVCHRAIAALATLYEQVKPDVVLVQGDTSTALAGALTGFYLKIPVGHVEAGLRSGNAENPFPEEMNRRVISQLASYHFAATEQNGATLRQEGIPSERIVLCGNPVVDSLNWALAEHRPSDTLTRLLERVSDKRLLVLTTHRRESFGQLMQERLEHIAHFIQERPDMAMIFPVHPNPVVREAASRAFGKLDRALLIEPLDYFDFIHLLSRAWLIVSDSGGVQEEAPTLKKPLLILRENTERPEAVDSGTARLVGPSPEKLRAMLEEIYTEDTWAKELDSIVNPFGTGDAGKRIARALKSFLEARQKVAI